jgi:hypothetical protein
MKFSRPANTAEVVEFEEIDPQIGQKSPTRHKAARHLHFEHSAVSVNRWKYCFTVDLFYSEFVGRPPATLEKRIPINPFEQDR